MNRRFVAALSIYAGLALLAGVTLDGNIRLFTWIFLGLLAFRTWLAVLKQRMD